MSTKISQLTSAVDVTANDLIQIVDVEDGVMAPSGTNKKTTASLLAKELAKQPLEPGVVISGSSVSDAVRITQTGAGNALVVEDSTNPDSTPTVITATGNVGIGTSSPAAKLDVAGNAYFGATISTGTGVSTADIQLEVGGNRSGNGQAYMDLHAAAGADFNARVLRTGGTNGDMQIINAGTGALTIATNTTERMRITSDGNVGIGTSSPEVAIQVNKANSSAVRVFETGGSVDTRITSLVSAGIIGTYSNHPTVFYANATERMRIDAGGNVGIGTSSPSYQLQLSTDSAAKPSTSTWTVSSDERLKENIEAADLDICYNAVKSIPLKRYKWKDEIYSAEQVADRSKIGWIAQDVQAVFPKAVGQHKFVYNQVKDEEGNIVSEDSIDDCLSLNSDQLYAALFGAVQKLMGEVESLQDRIAELESAP